MMKLQMMLGPNIMMMLDLLACYIRWGVSQN